MNIISHGYRATASVESMEATLKRLQGALDALEPELKHDPLVTLIDAIANEIESLEIDIKGAKKEIAIAEDNAAYNARHRREDFPNA